MSQATKQGAARKVSAEEVKRRMDRGEAVVFVDSRNSQAWSQSNEKLPGAIRIPAGEVEGSLSEIPIEGPAGRWIVTYCT